MMHISNLESLFKWGAFFSLEKLYQHKIVPNSIANRHVQNLRERIFIRYLTKLRPLHSYIPFYFARRTPMLRAQKEEVRSKIIFFEISRSILKDQGVMFTDGNATNQQLSKYKGEPVEIIPATASRNSCCRYYHPNGPNGTNPNCSNIYADVLFLERLDWDAINCASSGTDEKRRMKQAEVLVPDRLVLEKVQNIFTSSKDMAREVDRLIAMYHTGLRISHAVCKSDMF